jgi:hypothetical protein
VDAARVIADKLVKDAASSTSLATVAAKEKLTVAQIGPVNRFGQAINNSIIVDEKRTSPELLGQLFNAKIGDTVSAPVADGVVVARLREVIPATGNPEIQSQSAQVADNLRQTVGNDLIAAMNRAFAERYPAKINRDTLDSMAGTTN